MDRQSMGTVRGTLVIRGSASVENSGILLHER
jgi:hypothetical protein